MLYPGNINYVLLKQTFQSNIIICTNDYILCIYAKLLCYSVGKVLRRRRSATMLRTCKHVPSKVCKLGEIFFKRKIHKHLKFMRHEFTVFIIS